MCGERAVVVGKERILIDQGTDDECTGPLVGLNVLIVVMTFAFG